MHRKRLPARRSIACASALALAGLCLAREPDQAAPAPAVHPSFQSTVLIQVPVRDLDRSVAFYRDVLGFRVAYDLGAQRFTAMASPVAGLTIGLQESPNARGSCGVSINLAVGDLDAARTVLEAKGVEFLGPTETIPGVVRLASFPDPDGNLLKLAGAAPRPAKPLPQPPPKTPGGAASH